jgi:hypothetical protein
LVLTGFRNFKLRIVNYEPGSCRTQIQGFTNGARTLCICFQCIVGEELLDIWIRSFEAADSLSQDKVDNLVFIKTNAPAFRGSRVPADEDDHGEGNEQCEEYDSDVESVE